jgi:hypothetical protein
MAYFNVAFMVDFIVKAKDGASAIDRARELFAEMEPSERMYMTDQPLEVFECNADGEEVTDDHTLL